MATAAAIFVQRSTSLRVQQLVGHAAPVRETLGTAAGTAIACNRGWPWATYEDDPGCGEIGRWQHGGFCEKNSWFIEPTLW